MKNFELYNWIEYYKNIGLPEEVYIVYLPYISRLLDNDVPVILEFKQLAELLGKTEAYLGSAINAQYKHYRSFNIKKKSGGVRNIKAPYPALLDCQKWIYKNILSKATLNDAAHGFRGGKSIISNASVHIGCDELLNVDLKDFFPSISIRRVIKVFNDLGYPNDVSYCLASLCCLNNQLPQGAATSPVLSNIIAKGLDVRLSHAAKRYGLKYSRYADDLSFSGPYVPRWFVNLVSKIVESCGFSLNGSKTRLAAKSSTGKMVTGLVVKDDQLVLPRKYRRNLRQELYFIKEYGLPSHLAVKKIRDPEYLNRLQGKLQFWKQVEPEAKLAKSGLIFIRNLK